MADTSEAPLGVSNHALSPLYSLYHRTRRRKPSLPATPEMKHLPGLQPWLLCTMHKPRLVARANVLAMHAPAHLGLPCSIPLKAAWKLPPDGVMRGDTYAVGADERPCAHRFFLLFLPPAALFFFLRGRQGQNKAGAICNLRTARPMLEHARRSNSQL